MYRLLLIAALIVIAAPSAQAGLFERAWVTATRDVQFGVSAEEKADLYLPHGPNHPAVIMVHGGGWRAGDKAGYSFYANKLAAKGVAAIAIDYRLFKDTPESQWPAQIEDVQLAVRWVRANAQKFGIDPNRICAWGDSAGGHLSLLLGSMKNIKPGDRAHLFADQSPAVKCVINMFGPTNLAAPSLGNMRDLLTSMFGGKTPEQAPKVWNEASPAMIVSASSAPTLIIHGTTDDIVSFEQAKDLKAAFEKNGVAYEFIPFNGGHWFKDVADEGIKSAINQKMIDYAVKTLKP